MSAYKDNNFNDRRDTAANAKKALLERFRAQPRPDDPAVLARQAERKAIAEARDKRAAERQTIREAEAARRKIEDQKRAEEEAARRKDPPGGPARNRTQSRSRRALRGPKGPPLRVPASAMS
jgi:hypothetical protein